MVFFRMKTTQRPVIQKNQNQGESDRHGLAQQSEDKSAKNEQISFDSLFLRVINIQAEGQHPEKAHRASLR